MAEEIRQLTDDEWDAAFSGPALYANRFFITVGPTGARIAFSEQAKVDSGPIFRAAVMVPFQDAIELAKVLRSLLSEIEQQIDKAKVEAVGGADQKPL